MATVAFLGVGMLGAGMARAALGRGDRVAVYNRTRAKAEALAGAGARVCDTAAEAARGAERIHVVLSDDAAVDATLDAAREGLAPGALVVDHTTTSPEGTARRVHRLARQKIDYLHAPVFMSPAMAEEGKGIMLASGPRWVYDRVAPELGKMAGELVYLGERPDLAAGYKLFGNAMLFAVVAGLADVFTMAHAMGVEPDAARSLFSKFQPARSIELRGAKMAQGDFSPSFEVSMAHKDARLMAALAERAGGGLQVLPAVEAALAALAGAGHGGADFGALAKATVDRARRPERDPIDQLVRSHRRLEETIGDLAAAAARGPGALAPALAEAAEFFDKNGRRHEEDEEESLFPRLGERERELVRELATEHSAHERLTKRVVELAERAGREGDAAVLAETRDVCRDLQHVYHAHIALEEGLLFPAARLSIGPDALAEMGREMQARRGR